MNKHTGKALDTLAHIHQSIEDILTTPVGSRCLNRTYGSNLHRWLDAPFNVATQAQLVYETAVALQTWEPRIRLQRTLPRLTSQGTVVIDLEATVLADGQPLRLQGLRLG